MAKWRGRGRTGYKPLIAVWGDSLPHHETFWANIRVNTGTLVLDQAVGGTGSTQAKNAFLAAEKFRWMNVFWVGHNEDPGVVATITGNIDEMVEAMRAVGNERFLIFSTVNGSAAGMQGPSGAGYLVKIATGEYFEATYPNNYFNIRRYLVEQYDPEVPQDVIDFGQDVVPSSLREDYTHLTNGGYIIAAKRAATFMFEKGWVTGTNPIASPHSDPWP